MNRQLAMIVAAGVLTLSACKQEGTSVSNNQTQGVTDETVIDNSGALNMSDAQGATMDQAYVMNAAASDMFEMESSRLALEKATIPAVKTYAQMMIDEHGKSSQELKAAAASSQIAVPEALPADKQAKVEALRGLGGAEFDRQYLADQRSGHQETLAKVNQYIATAQPGPLKDHASKLTGVVQNHLNALEKIR